MCFSSRLLSLPNPSATCDTSWYIRPRSVQQHHRVTINQESWHNPQYHCMFDWKVILGTIQHKIGHFGDVSPSQSLGLVWKKTKPNTTHTKLKPGLVAVYDIWPGNGAGPFSKFSKENISKGGDKLRKNWRKRTSGKAHDINKQTTYIALKSKIELRVHYATRSLHGAIVSLQSHNSILLHLTGGSLRREPSIEVNTQTISATLFSRDCEL